MAVRFPWMDRDLVETCLAVPASWKLGGGHTRRVVRAAAADLLPPSVQNRPTKANFSRVFHDGLRRDHAEIDAATADLDALRFAVDPDALRAACRNYLAGDDRAWRAPWTAVVLGGFLARRA